MSNNKNKVDNIVSNVFGIIILAIAAYRAYEGEDIKYVGSLALGGFIALLFKVSETKAYIKKIIDKWFGTQKARPDFKASIGGDKLPPSEEEEPAP